MTVTSLLPQAPETDPETAASIDLAVAQWMRSPRATSLARDRLLALGVAGPEIEERRRCRSHDPQLATLLRLAVTLLITRGQLTPRDLARLPAPARDATLRAVAHATSLAFLRVTLANAVERSVPFPPIDLEIGDY